jgi:hypothetical protein
VKSGEKSAHSMSRLNRFAQKDLVYHFSRSIHAWRPSSAGWCLRTRSRAPLRLDHANENAVHKTVLEVVQFQLGGVGRNGVVDVVQNCVHIMYVSNSHHLLGPSDIVAILLEFWIVLNANFDPELEVGELVIGGRRGGMLDGMGIVVLLERVEVTRHGPHRDCCTSTCSSNRMRLMDVWKVHGGSCFRGCWGVNRGEPRSENGAEQHRFCEMNQKISIGVITLCDAEGEKFKNTIVFVEVASAADDCVRSPFETQLIGNSREGVDRRNTFSHSVLVE